MTAPEQRKITREEVDEASVKAAIALRDGDPNAERLTNEANRLWTLWTFQQEKHNG